VIRESGEVPEPSTGSNMKVTRLPMFNREASKMLEFLTACKLYIRMKMREILVEKQV